MSRPSSRLQRSDSAPKTSWRSNWQATPCLPNHRERRLTLPASCALFEADRPRNLPDSGDKMIERHGLRVDGRLDDFIMGEALPDTGINPEAFWRGFSGLIRDLAPKNRALLEKRDQLQARIDAWWKAH